MATLTWMILLAAALPAPAAVWFVDDDAAGDDTGTSWADAFPELQSALAVAQADDEIWVAAGVYRPSARADPGDPRSATFRLVRVVGVYGGFAGTETQRDQRDPETNETILSGDFDHDGDVDLADYLTLTACMSGPGRPTAPDCTAADLDHDGDTDLADLLAFQAAFTGSR